MLGRVTSVILRNKLDRDSLGRVLHDLALPREVDQREDDLEQIK